MIDSNATYRLYVVPTTLDGLTHGTVFAEVVALMCTRRKRTGLQLVPWLCSTYTPGSECRPVPPANWFIWPESDVEVLMVEASWDGVRFGTLEVNCISPASFGTAVTEYVEDEMRELLGEGGISKVLQINHGWALDMLGDDSPDLRLAAACIAATVAQLSEGAIYVVAQDRREFACAASQLLDHLGLYTSE